MRSSKVPRVTTGLMFSMSFRIHLSVSYRLCFMTDDLIGGQGAAILV